MNPCAIAATTVCYSSKLRNSTGRKKQPKSMKRARSISLAVVVMTGAIALGFALARHARERQVAEAVQKRARFSLKACIGKTYGNDALCGTYEVWEDRAGRSGRKIGLNIVILPARNSPPAPDPVFWLHGGPGAAATDLARGGWGGLPGNVRDTRDLVYVDQRGTGGSNALYCDFNDDPNDLPAFFGELFPLDKVRACREKLEKIANLKLYTTPIAMNDLDEVRAALGYDKINLVGGSYGTFAAQIFMRQHPEHIRAVFLAGVAPPNIKQPLLFPKAAQLALDEMFRDCAANADCHRTFPDIEKEFAAVLARFDKGPVGVELLDPRSKEQVQIKLPRGNFVERLRLELYTTDSARLVPYVIHRAFEGDYAPFEALAIHPGIAGGVARGMYMTVTCSEGIPFISEEDIARETKNTFVGDYRVRAHMEACKEWPRGDIPRNYTELVKSDLPVLMISGEADGASAPWYGEAAVKNFPKGRQVKIPHYGHQTDGPCVAGMFKAFIEEGSAEGIDTSCAVETRRPPFETALPKEFALQ
jgi:pimeloyl-ACP methyl ester carboxylesterase